MANSSQCAVDAAFSSGVRRQGRTGTGVVQLTFHKQNSARGLYRGTNTMSTLRWYSMGYEIGMFTLSRNGSETKKLYS